MHQNVNFLTVSNDTFLSIDSTKVSKTQILLTNFFLIYYEYYLDEFIVFSNICVYFIIVTVTG